MFVSHPLVAPTKVSESDYGKTDEQHEKEKQTEKHQSKFVQKYQFEY